MEDPGNIRSLSPEQGKIYPQYTVYTSQRSRRDKMKCVFSSWAYHRQTSPQVRYWSNSGCEQSFDSDLQQILG